MEGHGQSLSQNRCQGFRGLALAYWILSAWGWGLDTTGRNTSKDRRMNSKHTWPLSRRGCVCVGFCYSRILSTFIPPWCIQATMAQWIPQDPMLSLNTSLLISVHLFVVEFQLCSCWQILKTNWGLAESIPKDMRGYRGVPSQQETKSDLLRRSRLLTAPRINSECL